MVITLNINITSAIECNSSFLLYCYDINISLLKDKLGAGIWPGS